MRMIRSVDLQYTCERVLVIKALFSLFYSFLVSGKSDIGRSIAGRHEYARFQVRLVTEVDRLFDVNSISIIVPFSPLGPPASFATKPQ